MKKLQIALAIYALVNLLPNTALFAQRQGIGKLERTPETPFQPVTPSQTNFVGWNKFQPFKLNPNEDVTWQSVLPANPAVPDFEAMRNRGFSHFTHINEAAPPQLIPNAKERHVIVYANVLEGTRFVDFYYGRFPGAIHDPFGDENNLIISRLEGYLRTQASRYNDYIPGQKCPFDIVSIDLENHWTDAPQYRNLMLDGHYAIQGAKGHFSNNDYLNDYRANNSNDGRSNQELLLFKNRQTLNNGIYARGGAMGHLSYEAYKAEYYIACGTKIRDVLKHLKENVLMPGARVWVFAQNPGDPDFNMQRRELTLNRTQPYDPLWLAPATGSTTTGDHSDFADTGVYLMLPRHRPDGTLAVPEDADFESHTKKMIANDNIWPARFLTSIENTTPLLKNNQKNLTYWFPFYDGVPNETENTPQIPVRDDMGEAVAIFGLMMGTDLVVWSGQTYKTPFSPGSNFRACEYFISGLKRMSWHNDIRQGNYSVVIPEISLDGGETWYKDDSYQSWYEKRPLVRAIVNGNQILVAAYNQAEQDKDVQVMVKHGSWQDTITLYGRNRSLNRRTYLGRALMY